MARDLLQHGRMVRLYAERVLHRTDLEPDDMPELASNPEFAKMKLPDRAAFARGIRIDAASRLVEAGYNAATVKRILRV